MQSYIFIKCILLNGDKVYESLAFQGFRKIRLNRNEGVIGDRERLTIHPGYTIHQLADFNIQGVVTDIQLMDHLVHTC